MNQISADQLEQFLVQVGRCYRHPGRLYLVGGSSLILVNAKESTLDVDIQFDVDDIHLNQFIQCLRDTARRLQIPVEQAAPDQFIPLPDGYEQRHQFIGRYGLLEVFHYDFYSVALSKLYRGNEKDFADISSLLDQALIDFETFHAQYVEILPQIDFFRLNASRQQLEQNFALLQSRRENT